ncbi:hypothetical protein AB4Z46_34375 [Variovorax sp. M-6]|uniref:hypothetical protein n=1 Tax=Variovorax sp. M-6 TaxID=3233041 RepID=UPI003F956B6E
MTPPVAAIVCVRRKSALLAAMTLLLAALGWQGHAAGYPMGMSLLAASTVQAVICCAVFRSRLLNAMTAANFLLFLFHTIVISRFLGQDGAPIVFHFADFGCAVLGAASLVFTPIETMALVVREAYLRRPRRRTPP